MTDSPRPLSPHLQVYRLPLTGLISISHRITGVLLLVGIIYTLLLLLSLAMGEAAYLALQGLMQTALAKVLWLGFIFALMFHTCHGIRHLIWDCGHSFERQQLQRYALIELAASLVLTLVYWFLAR